ncbi:hypothetical protein JD969_20025 [Planctomycetota bacterium]|nr:hypothetical protein JD969_20025 [Planctomycetota bacterium]
MKKATTVSPGGQYHLLLQSLRHIKDPELRSLYEHLTAEPNPAFNIHGVLALAEISAEKKIDSNMLAEMSNVSAQGQIIASALDSDLVSDEQLAQLLDWQGLDIGVKMLIMTRKPSLITDSTKPILMEALKSDKIGRRSLAAYLLNEVGDSRGRQHLDALDASDERDRDPTRSELLGIMLRNQYPGYGEWANKIAKDSSVPLVLRTSALIAALRFNLPGAEDAWIETYETTENFALKLRVAYSGLSVAPFIGPRIYEHMATSDSELIKQIARTGFAISTKSEDLAMEVNNLIGTQHAMAVSWAIKYARDYASETDQKEILIGVVYSYGDAKARARNQRLNDIGIASQQMYELDAELAINFLNSILSDAKSDPKLTQAILLGLVRTHDGGVSRLINSVKEFSSPEAGALALLILARENQNLSRKQIGDLALIVRGGTRLEESLRIQAAWMYLKYTNQTQEALQAVLRR